MSIFLEDSVDIKIKLKYKKLGMRLQKRLRCPFSGASVRIPGEEVL
jgi:hypothetical protein